MTCHNKLFSVEIKEKSQRLVENHRKIYAPPPPPPQLPCGTKFLRVLIFGIFAVFFAIRKNKFLQNKITSNSFSAKIYSTAEIIYKNTGLKEKMP